MKNQLLASSIAVITAVGCSTSSHTITDSQNQWVSMQEGFKAPPDSIKPFVYWYWLNDNISPDGIIKDLQSMQEVGIGGAFIGNIGLTEAEGTPYGNVKLFSDTWWKATEAAMRHASENNFTLGMFNSPGWSQSGGPWVKQEESMRFISGEELIVKGPVKLNLPLQQKADSFQDVALLAFPLLYKKMTNKDWQAVVSSNQTLLGLTALVDDSKDTFVEFPASNKDKVWLDIHLNKACSARSIILHPAAKAFSTSIELQASINNKFETVKRFEMDRSNRNLHVGFVPDAPIAVSIPLTVSNNFRLVFSNATNPIALAEVEILEHAIVENYMEKQLAKMYPTPLPLWKEYQWPAAASDIPVQFSVPANMVKNISSYLSKEGVLTWEVPEGDWVISRYGMQSTRVTNSPASPEGLGLEVDKINKAALKPHFDAFIGKVLQKIPAEHRTAFKYVVADSYEVGSQNWTDGMAGQFVKRYNYDPIPFLPVLNGTIVNSADESDRFLWDLRRLVADMVATEYVGGLRELSNKRGLKLWLENYGHWGFPSEFLKYGGESDEVSGEFWNEGELGNIENRAASSSAHIYGKKRVWAESFTAGGGTYARYPGMLKRRGDWSFTEGVNQTLFHLYIHQPYEDKRPGVNAWFSTEFNRKNTWFPYSKSYIDYIRRSNFMLQQGLPVNDIAYFIGEDAPKMTGVRDPEIPAGYSYDYINADVIMNRLTVKDGRFFLPHGLSYAMIVLPKLETMTPELVIKLKELVSQGGVIMGPAPLRSPSLMGYPAADQHVKQAASELWGGKSIQKGVNAFGKGYVMNGIAIQEAMDYLKIAKDFSSELGSEVLYAHRKVDDTDIYFITNQSDKPLSFDGNFRVSGKQPEWWDGVTGSRRRLPDFELKGGATRIPLRLLVNESAFIVFNDAVESTAVSARNSSSNFPEYTTVQTIGNTWNVRFKDINGEQGKVIAMDKLVLWNELKDKDLRTFSGSALYVTSFEQKDVDTNQPLFLDLGAVYIMAKVRVNGEDAGTLWTAPWRIDIAKYLKPGTNKLEIEVINTWANQLIGESNLPAIDKKWWTSYNLYKPEDALYPAGLLGPVTLQSASNVK